MALGIREYIEDGTEDNYIYTCIHCGCTKRRVTVSDSFIGYPPTILKFCLYCNKGGWTVSKKV